MAILYLSAIFYYIKDIKASQSKIKEMIDKVTKEIKTTQNAFEENVEHGE